MEGSSHTFPGVRATGPGGQAASAMGLALGWGRCSCTAAGPARPMSGARAGFTAAEPAVGSSSKTWRSAALSCRVNKLARETILLQLVGETLFR